MSTVVAEYGGPTALNDIHLATALSRLAKMDLRTPAAQRPQPQPREPPQPWLRSQVQAPPQAQAVSPQPAPPPSPPPRGLPPFPAPNGLGPPGRLPLSPPPPPRSMALGAPPSALPAQPGAPLPTRGSPSLPAAASPEDLFLALTEELAGRCGDGRQGPGPAAGPAARGMSGRATGAAAAGSQPIQGRVLANGVWAASRLALVLWPRLSSGGAATSALGLGPVGSREGRAAAALRAVLRAVPRAAPSLEPQHVSNLLYSTARLAEAGLPGVVVLDAWAGAAAGRAQASEHEQEGRSGVPAGAVVTALLDASQGQLADFGPQALSNSIYALALLDHSPPGAWAAAWLQASAAALPRADPQHLANMLWALARLRLQPGGAWIEAALAAAARKAPAFTTQGLCNTLWALARLGSVPASPASRRALLPLARALGAAAAECDGQDVANGMWALARLHAALLAGPTEGEAAARSAQARTDSGAAGGVQPPTDSSGLGGALEGAGRALLHHSARQLGGYSGQQLANTAWAAASLGLVPPPAEWAAAFWPAAQSSLPLMRTEELVAAATAAVRLGLTPTPEWLSAMLDLTAAALAADTEPSARAAHVAGDGGAGGAVAAWQGQLHASPQPQRLEMTGRALASLLWCLAGWQMRPPAEWMAAVLGRLEALAAAGQLEPTALATALQSMARLRLRPERLVAGWTARVVEAQLGAEVALPGGVKGAWATGVDVGAGYDPRAARMVLWALAVLRGPVAHEAAGRLALAAAGAEAIPDPLEGAGGGSGPGADAWSESQGQGGSGAAAGAVQVAMALWALARMRARPSGGAMRRLVAAAVAVMPRARAREVRAMVRAFEELGYRPGPRFSAAAEARARELKRGGL